MWHVVQIISGKVVFKYEPMKKSDAERKLNQLASLSPGLIFDIDKS